jgi:hypothetical protein
MIGKSCVALPACISVLPTPFRSGIGPSGSAGSGSGLSSGGLRDRAEVEVTAVISATVGAFQFWTVAMLAVAVSLTDLTRVALDATAIWACKTTGRFAETELTEHWAVPSPLAQPFVNVAFWLIGCAVSATDTSGADVSRVETRTMYVAVCPRVMLAWDRWTLTHSSGCAFASALACGLAVPAGLVLSGLVLSGLVVSGLGLGLAPM